MSDEQKGDRPEATGNVTSRAEGSRSVSIGRDAVGNTLITGDGNVVVIQAARALEEEQPEPTPIGPNPY